MTSFAIGAAHPAHARTSTKTSAGHAMTSPAISAAASWRTGSSLANVALQ